jgi:hypothetical protein
LSLARLYPAFASPEPIELSFDYAAGALPADYWGDDVGLNHNTSTAMSRATAFVSAICTPRVVGRLFRTHPLQRSASASDKMDVRLPAWGLPSVAA